MEVSQRRTPRYPFAASAEIVGATSVAVTEVTELNLYGCHLVAICSLPRGTVVTVKIRHGGQCLEARASVLYSQPMLGMAVAFRKLQPECDAILREWLQQSLDKQNAKPTIENFKKEN
jgi:hypothetical protein